MITLKDLRVGDLFICYDMDMNQDGVGQLQQGLTTEDAQHMICQGTYGGKEWSASERSAACQRHEDLQGTTSFVNLSTAIPLLILLIIVAYISYQYVNKRRTSGKINARKGSRK